MKKLLPFAFMISSAIWFSSCSHKEVATQQAKVMTMQEIDSIIFGYPFYVSKAYKMVGKDSINLLADTIIQIYQNAVFLTFYKGGITRYNGKPMSNKQFPASAKTFNLNMRFSLPTALSYHWDEDKKTMVVESGAHSDLPIITPGKKAYLDQSKFTLTRNYQETKDAVVPRSMTFNYEDNVIEMRPMFIYGQDSLFTYYKYLVVF